MHDDHNHSHSHASTHSHAHTHTRDHDDHSGHSHRHHHAGPGHNHAHAPRAVAQWQTPHLGPDDAHPNAQGEPDLDQVEAAFIEGFLTASDPTSFLRLAGIPFKATAPDGAVLSLLRVETEVVADVGAVTPHLGGGSFRYDPLPAPLVARRRRLRFIYFDGGDLRPLGFAAVRGELAPAADRATQPTGSQQG
jgi:hypothetical protein